MRAFSAIPRASKVVSPLRFPFSLGRLDSRAGRVEVPRLRAARSSPTNGKREPQELAYSVCQCGRTGIDGNTERIGTDGTDPERGPGRRCAVGRNTDAQPPTLRLLATMHKPWPGCGAQYRVRFLPQPTALAISKQGVSTCHARHPQDRLIRSTQTLVMPRAPVRPQVFRAHAARERGAGDALGGRRRPAGLAQVPAPRRDHDAAARGLAVTVDHGQLGTVEAALAACREQVGAVDAQPAMRGDERREVAKGAHGPVVRGEPGLAREDRR